MFAPDGTLYTESALQNVGQFIVSISGTNSASPGTLDHITNSFESPTAVLPALNPLNISMPPFLLISGINNDMAELPLPVAPPPAPQQPTDVITGGSQGLYGVTGPDGCAYMTQSDRILRITNAESVLWFRFEQPSGLGELEPLERDAQSAARNDANLQRHSFQREFAFEYSDPVPGVRRQSADQTG